MGEKVEKAYVGIDRRQKEKLVVRRLGQAKGSCSATFEMAKAA